MVAGAGSGKTTSLIKALSGILKTHGEHLRSRRQKVACITYTDIAAGEIWADVGNNPLVHVSTIHSFLWSTVKHFQPDIKNWVSVRIEDKIADFKEKAANFGTRVQQKTKDKNRRDTIRYENQRGRIQAVPSFKYGTGSDYANGILGHDDVIKIGTTFLTGRPLIRQILSQQFPFLFVDESQDTFESVVESLKAVGRAHKNSFCLGFFGDPMQQIYNTGIGTIPPDEGWEEITKPENFRCPQSVLSVSNAIRRDGDGLKQVARKTIQHEGKTVHVPGTAILFIASTKADRDKTIAEIRALVAIETKDSGWVSISKNDPVKVLVIVHRMAAKRLGFGDIYSALNDSAPDQFKNGFLDASAWPLRPFTSFLLPLVIEACAANEFGVMEILRKQCKQLRPEVIQKKNVAEVLASLRKHTQHFQKMLAEDSKATVSEVLNYLTEADLIELDPRLLSYVTEKEVAEEPAKEEQDQDEDELSKEIASMEAFLQCPARQFLGYSTYIQEQSPFSTQQGIKGAEFERVLVILDDDEGTHVQFSYDKYFGLKELSDKEQENRREGKETSVERTRRLFYVCCTRAKKDLVVVYFVDRPAAAREKILALKLFPPESVKIV
jgi:DNA helicase-2/ATP-dependent DNA helicase PcrA